jgi:NAD(P)-dependent dehydrogenase (short-subunit alcohol dehydrogenase family)
MDRFIDRKIVVTGAGSGIGQATVARLLAEGGEVVGMDINELGLAATTELANEAGHRDRLTTLYVDIGDESSVKDKVAAALAKLGGLDVLVNAAGILRSSHTAQTPLDFWNTMLRVNLTGTFLMTREALPALLPTGRGVIVNFSSTSAAFAHPYMAAYAATKGGIQSFTHAIAMEYSKQGLRALCVCPGSIQSGMTNDPGLPADADWSLLGKLRPALPLKGNYGPPSTVASVIAMMASDDGAFVTGTEIRIDGGTHM